MEKLQPAIRRIRSWCVALTVLTLKKLTVKKLRLRPIRVLLFITVSCFLQASALAQGCAICQAALGSSPEGRALAGSFAKGILLLLGAPFALMALGGFVLFRAYRKKRTEESSTR